MHACCACEGLVSSVRPFVSSVRSFVHVHVYVPVSAVLMCRSCLPVSATVSTCTSPFSLSLSPSPPSYRVCTQRARVLSGAVQGEGGHYLGLDEEARSCQTLPPVVGTDV